MEKKEEKRGKERKRRRDGIRKRDNAMMDRNTQKGQTLHTEIMSTMSNFFLLSMN